MDKLINIAVNGSHLRMDSSKGGVQGEVNATKLRITFDKGWDGLAKTITFHDALGNNPVQTLLTADNLENIVKSARVYICAIPGEALAEGGWFEFIIEGADNNKKVRSAEGKLYAEAAFSTEGAATPEEITLSQAELIQSQIDNLLGDMQELAVMAADSAERAAVTEEAASASASAAATSASNAANSVDEAAGFADNAKAEAERAEAAAGEAESFRVGAATRAQEAQANAQLCHDYFKRIEEIVASYITVSKTDIEPGVTALANGRLYAYYIE